MGKMIAALKKLGNKLNGKLPVSENTVGVINEIADDYEKPDLTPYTAGNGITITEENVINADVKTIIANGIESLTDEQCEALNIGDVVISSDAAYVVNYKNKGAGSLSLSELDLVNVTNHEIINERYTKSQGSSWQYMGTTEKNLDLFNLVFLDGNSGDITDADDISAIVDRAYIMLNDSTILLPTYAENIPGGTLYHYSSVVYQDKANKTYLECTVSVDTGGAQVDYQVETKTISSGSSVHLYHVLTNDISHNDYEFSFTCGSSEIEDYQSLGEYLYTHGFIQGYISSTDSDCVPLNVTPAYFNNGHQITGIYATMTLSCDEPVYQIYTNGMYISSGELVIYSELLDEGEFNLAYIGSI